MTLPRKIERQPRFNMAKRIRSPGHLAFVREHGCCVPGCTGRPIEAHHVRLGSHAGMGQKPGDDRAVSLCADHHRWVHLGEATFQTKHGINLQALADEFVKASPHRKRLMNAL